MKKNRGIFLFLLSVFLVGCTKIVSDNNVINDVKDEVFEEIPILKPSLKEESELLQDIKYKLEGNALVFYGKGVLMTYIVNECANEFTEAVQNIEKIIIEDGVTEIGEYAFCNSPFSAVKTIEIAGSVKIIGSMAFADCRNIEMVKIKEGVEFIGSGAFLGCTYLKNVTIPQSVKVISRFAFLNTMWLENEIEEQEIITVNGIIVYVSNEDEFIDITSNITYASRSLLDESPWLELQKKENDMIIVKDTLVASGELSGDVIVPEGVKYIAEMAFSGCTEIQSISLPESVEFIGGYAFENCTSLTTVEMQENVKYIAESAFEGCSSLKNIELSSNIQCMGRGAFYNCTSIENVCVPECMKYLADYTYYGCTNLESVEIKEGLICIENFVFSACENLEKISIPQSVDEIGAYTFDGTEWLAKQIESNDLVVVNNIVISASKDIKEMSIPDGVKEIVYGAYEGCQMVSISMPDTIEKIGGFAFNNCSNLRSIALPNNLKYLGYGVFNECSNLESIAIPKHIKNLDTDLFSGCKSLTIFCSPDSMAKQYALENAINYVEVDEQFWLDGAPMFVKLLSLKEKIEMGDGTIEIEGDLYNAIWGEEGAFVWRFIEATFDEDAYHECCFITDDKDVAKAKNLAVFAQYYCTGWSRWRGNYDGFVPTHIGDDMFYITANVGKKYAYYYLNQFTLEWFTNATILNDDEDIISRYTDFNDGYAVCAYLDTYYTEWYGYQRKNEKRWIVLLDKLGNMHKTDIETTNTYHVDLGMYSDGVFYFNNAFYDVDSNVILDLSGRNYGTIYVSDSIDAPYFENGVCTLITEKNGKYWIFDIDKSGNMLNDAEEVDITLLDY